MLMIFLVKYVFSRVFIKWTRKYINYLMMSKDGPEIESPSI